MELLSTEDNFCSIIDLGEQLCHCLDEMDVNDLQSNMIEYNKKIINYFLISKSQSLTQTQYEELNQLILFHKKITEILNKKKYALSKTIKQLHSGKKIKDIYS